MMEIMNVGTVITSVAVFLCTTAIGFFAGKLSVKTKTELMVEKLHVRMDESEAAMQVVLACLLPLLIKAKDGKTNGELERALRLLNSFLIKK
ncbi:hypothetical protein LJC56_10160 [Christensenellaceae bacterium OttesenSCG-928-K19]|nr:hypothetical protein [Christensenellaceae bacterium OttesenSCG-928-K19]